MTLRTCAPPVNRVFNRNDEYDWSWLKKTLVSAAYTHGTVERFCRMPPAERDHRLLPLNRSSIFLRLFRFGHTIKEQDLCQFIDRDQLEALVGSGIILSDNAGFKAIGPLTWINRHIIVEDAIRGFNRVMPVSGSSWTLARMTPRKRVHSILDVGTGSGVQALLAASHAVKVVATDTSVRALEFASMNASLNGITNIEFREGSFFSPVQGESYDLIVANPPYVISPELQFAFQDGGIGGDKVSEHMVHTASEHLVEGGFAVILVEWYHQEGQSWDERPANWGENLGCDILWQRLEESDPISYAGAWFDGGSRDASRPTKTFSEWLQFYRNIGADRLNFGIVVLRKRSNATNWMRFEDFAEFGRHIVFADVGDQIATIFAAEDLNETATDDLALLDRRWKLHPAHLVQHEKAFEHATWKTKIFRLVSTQGAPFSCALDKIGMSLIDSMTSNQSLRDAIACVASTSDLDQGTVSKSCLTVATQLIRDGLLIPGD